MPFYDYIHDYISNLMWNMWLHVCIIHIDLSFVTINHNLGPSCTMSNHVSSHFKHMIPMFLDDDYKHFKQQL
jgi:hypothetical protein